MGEETLESTADAARKTSVGRRVHFSELSGQGKEKGREIQTEVYEWKKKGSTGRHLQLKKGWRHLTESDRKGENIQEDGDISWTIQEIMARY